MKLEISSKYPPGRTHPTPLLFAHGGLHAAWCWDVHFLDYFARNGFAAHAVSLRGHGRSEGRDSFSSARIADYVGDVVNTVRQLPNPPVLIGHSMGGLVVQKYLEDYPSPAAVLLSPPPPNGLLVTALRLAWRHPLVFAGVNLKRSFFQLVATPGLARDAFFSEEMADDQVLAYWRQMQEESFLAFLDMVALNLPKPAKVKIPLLVIGAELDANIMPKEIEATARAYNAQSEIVAGVAHDMMLEPRWQAVAERILVWLKRIIQEVGNLS